MKKISRLIAKPERAIFCRNISNIAFKDKVVLLTQPSRKDMGWAGHIPQETDPTMIETQSFSKDESSFLFKNSSETCLHDWYLNCLCVLVSCNYISAHPCSAKHNLLWPANNLSASPNNCDHQLLHHLQHLDDHGDDQDVERDSSCVQVPRPPLPRLELQLDKGPFEAPETILLF